MSFKFYQQLNQMDCGPTCLKIVAKHYGKTISLNLLRQEAQYSKEGVNLLGISEAAEKIGFRTQGVKLSFKQLIDEAPKPAILHWGQNHFVVLTSKVKGKIMSIADPARGLIQVPKQDFIQHWATTNYEGEPTGIALLLEPTPSFYEQEDTKEHKAGWGMLAGYLKQQKAFIGQLLAGLLVGTLLQLIFPFLTQSIVDTGITTHTQPAIYLHYPYSPVCPFFRTYTGRVHPQPAVTIHQHAHQLISFVRLLDKDDAAAAALF